MDGTDYHFVSKEEMEEAVKNNQFLEHTTFSGRCTPPFTNNDSMMGYFIRICVFVCVCIMCVCVSVYAFVGDEHCL